MVNDWDNTQDSSLLNGIRLFHHIAEKGFQMGSIFGVGIVTPYALWRGKQPATPSRILALVGRSALFGMAAATLMGSIRVTSIPADERAVGLQDRAYRLHFNQGQKRCDMFSEVGMAAGAATAGLLVSPAVMVVLGGAAAGCAAGVAGHVATTYTAEN